jgi:hypothetical protein
LHDNSINNEKFTVASIQYHHDIQEPWEQGAVLKKIIFNEPIGSDHQKFVCCFLDDQTLFFPKLN